MSKAKTITLIVLGVLVFGAVSLLLTRAQCVNDGEVMGIGVQWRAAGGCYYETPDGFVSEEVFRYRVPGQPVHVIEEEQEQE